MKKILIIDDDPFFAKNIKGVLDPKLYEVVSAADGEEGLKKIKDSVPDGILLDIMMPKMNGMDFLKQLNEAYGKNKIPVIITSNLSSFTKIAEGVSLGIRGYIFKSNESLQNIGDTITKMF